MEMNIPVLVMASVYHEIDDRLTVMGNISWQKQSEFGGTAISVGSPASSSFTTDWNFDNTCHFALGMQYRFSVPWLLSVGFAYDSDRTIDMPLDRQYR